MIVGEEKTIIKGVISRLSYQNSEKWSVFTVTTIDGDTTDCTGVLSDICQPDTDVKCIGDWTTSYFGRQFKCMQVIPILPDITSSKGVLKLLQRLPGIGPKKAELAIEKLGAKEAWEAAQHDPEKIGVRGASCEAAKKMAVSLLSSFETLNYLLGIGLTDHQAGLIIDRFGKRAVEVVSKEPYSLITNIDGFAFLTVDKIALKAGVPVGAKARVNACILHCLLDSEINGGHIYMWGRDLVGVVIDNLTESAKKAEVPLQGLPTYEDVRLAVYWLQDEGRVVLHKGKVFHADLLDAEKTIMEVL